MKKIIAILVLVAFVFTSAAFAESTFSSYTLEELFLLKMEIENEISSRTNGSDSIIPQGVYIVGKDIKAGSFEIGFGKKDGVYLIVTTYPNEANFQAYRSGEMEFNEAHDEQYTFREEGESAYVSLSDGMMLRLDGGTFIIKESNHSWKP